MTKSADRSHLLQLCTILHCAICSTFVDVGTTVTESGIGDTSRHQKGGSLGAFA